jgi:hypothetical protein
VFKPYDDRMDDSKILQSDEDDPELLLFIPFTAQVSMKSFCVRAWGETAPTCVRM